MNQKKYNRFTQLSTREKALTYFRSKRHYYDRVTEVYLCQGDNCGRQLKEAQVIDDHIDNDQTNNKPSNHQPLCKSCNTHNSGKTEEQMKQITRKRRKAFNSGFGKLNGISAQITINKQAEEPFRLWCVEQVRIYGTISWIDLIDGGCEYVTQNFVSLNQTTAERYLRKLTSFVGPLVSNGVGDSRLIELRNKREAPEQTAGPS